MPGGDPEMSDAIKLFGRRIAVPEVSEEAGEKAEDSAHGGGRDDQDLFRESKDTKVIDLTPNGSEELDCNCLDSPCGVNSTNDSNDNETLLSDKLTTGEQSESKIAGQEKVIKKPDKILPCPRCNSMDTKFCYFNNYNVNQPRHFCKKCQRYWTAGGTMRNVPVGAGRRKTKHSSHLRHMMTVSDGLPSSQIDGPDSSHGHPTRQSNGHMTVLKFGQEAQICDSIVNSLSLREQKKQVHAGGESVKGLTCSSSLVNSNSLEKESPDYKDQVNQNILSDPSNGLISMGSLNCYPGSPWAFHWSPGWNAAAAAATAGRNASNLVSRHNVGSLNPVPWSLPPIVAAPTFVGPTIPVPVFPASFLGCITSWPAGTWNTPPMGTNGFHALAPSIENNESLNIHSPRLGKHSRDSLPQVEEKVEKSLWIPKTLRIDDPEEAAKSSIWATLGIKHDQNEALVKGGIFKSFQTDNKASLQTDTQVMHANPAALSRSQTFQEST